MKIKKGDIVKVLSGKDRGKQGRVIRAIPRSARILVEGVNVKKRHRRSRRQDRKGEVVLMPAPLPASAVLVVCPHCSKPTRVGHRSLPDGTKARACKQCTETF